MTDLISRQTAIDDIYETFCYAYCDNCEKEMNEDLCGDCHRKYQNWAASKKIISKTINSLPSAESSKIQDILDYLDTALHPIISPEHWNVYSELYDMISMLPSAERHGRWIIYPVSPWDGEDVKCSVCGEKGCAPYWDYCPHCGSQMVDVVNEDE